MTDFDKMRERGQLVSRATPGIYALERPSRSLTVLALLAGLFVGACQAPGAPSGQRQYGFGAPASSQGGPRYTAGAGISIDPTTGIISSTVTSSIPPTFFGDGSDGACVLDGATACLGMTPSSGVYTNNLGRALFFSNLTINSGITFKPAGYPVAVNGTLTFVDGTSVISNSGGNAAGGTGGAASSVGSLGNGTNPGGNGGAGGGLAVGGGNSSHAPREFAAGHVNGGTNAAGVNGGVGQGGSGGDSSSGGGAPSGDTLVTGNLRSTREILVAVQSYAAGDNQNLSCGTGGGGGRAGTGTGGGGGGGGCWNVVEARAVVGAGSIRSNGGNGANGTGTDGCGGGGGGGGVAVLVTDSTTVTATVTATGGTKGVKSGTGFDGGNGGAGLAFTFKGA